jgi:segregation and condensation protein A
VSAGAGFEVELPLFSGPFRLLAELVLEQKIDVCDVPIARVTDLFLARGMEAAEQWDLEEASWFLVMCALMLELKVGRLMPQRPAPQSEEDLLGGTPPDLLYARSIELAAFRRVAEDLAERMAAASLLVPRAAGPPPEFAHLYPDVMERVKPEVLRAAAAELTRRVPVLDLSHVTPIRATLADALDALRARLTTRPEALFRELLDDCEERIEVVVRFLAILELYREGKVELSQASVFGDIEVRWHDRAEGLDERVPEVGLDVEPASGSATALDGPPMEGGSA